MMIYKTQYNVNIVEITWCAIKRIISKCTKIHVLTLPNCNPHAQTAASYSLLNISLFYPNFIVPSFPSLAVAC